MRYLTRWPFQGFPEDPDPETEESLRKLLGLEREGTTSFIEQLARGSTLAHLDDLLTATHVPDRARVRGWYLGGQAFIHSERWDEALTALATGMAAADPTDLVALIHFHCRLAFAAHMGHHFETAIRYYDRLIEIWTTADTAVQQACLSADSTAFLCNLYRQQADTWLMLAVFINARSQLEQHALPLLHEYLPQQPTPLSQPTENQSEINWRELGIFVPWILASVISWQARLAEDPWTYEHSLTQAEDYLREALHLSRTMAQGQQWSSSIQTVIAEVMIQRCRLTQQRFLQALLCRTAREYLHQAGEPKISEEMPLLERLQALVLYLPRYELRWCELHVADTPHLADDLLTEITALQDQAMAVNDPGYRLLAARCSWLHGTIEADRRAWDSTATERAQARYHFALELLARDATLDTLIERGIRRDLSRLAIAPSS